MARNDYASVIDPATWGFIQETARWYPDETAQFPIAEQRRIYEAMCAAFRRPRPAGIGVQDAAQGGVPCRIYEPDQPLGTLVYLHGGGFVVGGLDSHDDICAELAQGCGLRVVAVDYRLAPEHPHPAAFDDACAAICAVAARWPGRLLLAGDSAGGALAASAAHALRGVIAPAGMVLIYPALGGDRSRGSYRLHAMAPMLTLDDLHAYDALRHGGGPAPLRDATAAALHDDDFTGLPPTVLVMAECDPLAHDGPAYAARINAAGGRAFCITEPGLVHGYLRARHSVPRAADSFARICAALRALAAG